MVYSSVLYNNSYYETQGVPMNKAYDILLNMLTQEMNAYKPLSEDPQVKGYRGSQAMGRGRGATGAEVKLSKCTSRIFLLCKLLETFAQEEKLSQASREEIAVRLEAIQTKEGPSLLTSIWRIQQKL